MATYWVVVKMLPVSSKTESFPTKLLQQPNKQTKINRDTEECLKILVRNVWKTAVFEWLNVKI